MGNFLLDKPNPHHPTTTTPSFWLEGLYGRGDSLELWNFMTNEWIRGHEIFRDERSQNTFAESDLS